MKLIFKYILIVFLFSSCSKRNITYFSNLDLNVGDVYTANRIDNPIKIQKGDELEIRITTLDPESNLLFNYGVITDGSQSNYPANSTFVQSKYLVNDLGEIDFPIVGKIELAGLTKKEAKDKITASLGKLANNPRVDIAITNFKITVLGEVNQPNTFTIPDDDISVIEALGLAGDMTVYGKRENVLIIREDDGQKTLYRIDLNDKSLLGSPNFFLRQNDVLYVEADKKKLIQADINPTTIAVLTIVSSVAVAFIFNFQNIF